MVSVSRVVHSLFGVLINGHYKNIKNKRFYISAKKCNFVSPKK